MFELTGTVDRVRDGQTTFAIRETRDQGFVHSSIDLELDRRNAIERLHVTSARYGTAEWQTGKGLVRSTYWETEQESIALGGWAGHFPVSAAVPGNATIAFRCIAFVVERFRFDALKRLLVGFVATAARMPTRLTPQAMSELLAVVDQSATAVPAISTADHYTEASDRT